MFKLILVDDEEIALEGLSNYVDWKGLDFELVGTAQTIAEALALIRETEADVVLTDIQLEGESGLDLIRQLTVEFPQIRCVILSGHNDFEYARQALRYGTFDFLTKPILFDALRQTFTSLREQLLHDRQSSGQQQEYRELKRTVYFNNLAKGKISYDSAVARELGIHTGGPIFLARIRLQDNSLRELLPDGVKNRLYAAIQTLFDGITHDVFNNAFNEYALLVYYCPQKQLTGLLERFAAECGCGLCIGVSTQIDSLQRLARAYFEAGKALDYQLLKRNQPVICFDSVRDFLYTDSVITGTMEEQINGALLNKDVSALTALCEKMIDTILKNEESGGVVYTFCIEYYLLIDRFLHSYLDGYTAVRTVDVIRQIVLRDTQEDLRQYMRQCLLGLEDSIKEANPLSSDVVGQMQGYIREHYAENISLQTLADQFYLHPIYLSRLFKEKTGQNFIDYLTRVRFEKAKELLARPEIKIYNISQMVGYESPKYFSKIFKGLSGMTPSEYRDTQPSVR